MLTLLFLYFLPTVIAILRGRGALGIFLMNFLLGWTFVFWWVALLWSLTGGPRIYYVYR